MKKLFICMMFLLSVNPGFTGNKGSQGTTITGGTDLFSHFPESNYTPNGYLANPYHTAALNRSGVLRSVPPLGFGFWARPLPWPYGGAGFGFGLSRHRNYLSLLHLALNINDRTFFRIEDFENNNIELYSAYHTQNMMSYDFNIDGLQCRAMYFQSGEHSLVCLLEFDNQSDENLDITLHATNIYGDIYKGYWGCDGIVSLYNSEKNAAVSKFFADGDMFVLGADRNPRGYKATTSDSAWHDWLQSNDVSDRRNERTSLRIKKKTTEIDMSLGHMLSMLSYDISIAAGTKENLTFVLSRGLSEEKTVKRFDQAMENAGSTLAEKVTDDKIFYAGSPVLSGDWPQAWKHGILYHLETIRMNIHPPVGIYNHHWDGMQVHTPRVVLGESAIDAMCLSYADMDLAKDVILGTFADATDVNIPCSREDGSLNLVCGNGKETGTAPIWGLPFRVIHSMYLRDRDDDWITQLYPYMKLYIEWWLENRTDEEGWFHCACSWESGQDGSKRFRVGDVAATAEDVRTVDIEAAMANAIDHMVLFARIAGKTNEVDYWQDMADERIRRTRDMFVDGRFRDFDAVNGKPIILKDYYSVMMLAPLSFGVASKEQMAQSSEVFDYFRDNYRFWLEWPSFLFPFSEAAWNAGRRELLAGVLVNTGNSIFPGTDSRTPLYVRPKDAPGLPKQYSYRLPGVAAEWWPYKRGDQWAGGCENYGWGATFPTLMIRNIIGFREMELPQDNSFYLAPALPAKLFKQGKVYAISNLSYQHVNFNVQYQIISEKEIKIGLAGKSGQNFKLVVRNDKNTVLAKSDIYSDTHEISYSAENFGIYIVQVEFENGD